jgi:hypothetical protein
LSVTTVEERRAKQFLDHLKRCGCREDRPPLKPRRQKYSLHLFFQFLHRAGIVTNPTVAESALESPVAASFCEWMRRQRGASDATLSIYRFELRAFIKELGEDPSMYDARNLRSFVLRKSRHSGGASTRKSICAIRMFLRFLISQGKCHASLYASVPSLAHWRLSALPRYLQPAQVEKIIASADLRTSLGSRNRAILLLLARLGLRAGDIVRLRSATLIGKKALSVFQARAAAQPCCRCPKRLDKRWQPILRTIVPKLIAMRCLSDHLLRIVRLPGPLRSRSSSRAQCAVLASPVQSQEQLMFSVIPSQVRCSGEGCPDRRSLLCSAIAPF